MEFRDALAADGVVVIVGAGGKKTTAFALADRIPRAVVTTTTRVPDLTERVSTFRVTDDPRAAIEAAADFPVGVVAGEYRPGHYQGYDPDTVAGLRDLADAVLVKADGARGREFKAPKEGEPPIPANTDTVLPVASTAVVGDPLTDESVHRPERVAALTDLETGDTIEPEHVAAVLAHPDGGLKNVPADATVIPVLNKVDDQERRDIAEEIASGVHERADVARVALTSHVRDDPLVGVR
ncbi:selenium cofactor biosynthesis protein YqeC [Salarchaeum japonicum]|uniref:Selenium cofactor biosynthesis protein YqeC n=1 Tax=Salarchaeum japonicum TaxID=555573 RepID=A0AAV3T493_9EURY|nr:selenium cofactor biosynthesis protein YqeC [Salarchaeum japonicum]